MHINEISSVKSIISDYGNEAIDVSIVGNRIADDTTWKYVLGTGYKFVISKLFKLI
jgi:hypothetical protein